MQQAVFITLETDLPRDNKLELILPLVAGVKDWSLTENGELTVEYDEAEVGPAHIENAVEALGYRAKYAPDETEAWQTTHESNESRPIPGLRGEQHHAT